MPGLIARYGVTLANYLVKLYKAGAKLPAGISVIALKEATARAAVVGVKAARRSTLSAKASARTASLSERSATVSGYSSTLAIKAADKAAVESARAIAAATAAGKAAKGAQFGAAVVGGITVVDLLSSVGGAKPVTGIQYDQYGRRV